MTDENINTTFIVFLEGGQLASENARALLKRFMKDFPEVEVRIVDVTRNPEAAFAYGVLFTPLFIRLSPLPEIQLIGDLRGLDLGRLVKKKKKKK